MADHTDAQIAARIAGAIDLKLKELNTLIAQAQANYGLQVSVGFHTVSAPDLGSRQSLFAEYAMNIKPERMQE